MGKDKNGFSKELSVEGAVSSFVFQCLDDCYCDKGEFAEIWDSVREDKIAVFTRNVHGRNHVWQAEAYKLISEKFFDSTISDLIKLIKVFQE